MRLRKRKNGAEARSRLLAKLLVGRKATSGAAPAEVCQLLVTRQNRP